MSKAHVIVVWFPRLDPVAISLLQSVLMEKNTETEKEGNLTDREKKKRRAQVCVVVLHTSRPLFHTEKGN